MQKAAAPHPHPHPSDSSYWVKLLSHVTPLCYAICFMAHAHGRGVGRTSFPSVLLLVLWSRYVVAKDTCHLPRPSSATLRPLSGEKKGEVYGKSFKLQHVCGEYLKQLVFVTTVQLYNLECPRLTDWVMALLPLLNRVQTWFLQMEMCFQYTEAHLHHCR